MVRRRRGLGMEVELIRASTLPLERLTSLWNEAFQDYYVPMRLTGERYAQLVRRELISLPDSFVALADGEPAGFALAGLRRRDGRLLGYDAGTAVVPTRRRLGLARRLMEAMLDRFAELGVERVTLTAVSANRQAIALYQSLGFSELRQLSCWERVGKASMSVQTTDGLDIIPVPPGTVRFLQSACYRQTPEWQNCPDGDKLQTAEALLTLWRGRPIGYAVFAGKDPLYLYQLGVVPEWRRRGLARAMLQAIGSKRPHRNLIYLNHPAEEQEGSAWLQNVGFTVFLQQLEMGLSLSGCGRIDQSGDGDVTCTEEE